MLNESPTKWVAGIGAQALSKVRAAITADLDTCSKPKCLAYRHFVKAVVDDALEERDKTTEDIASAARYLRRDDGDGEGNELRVTVLALLLSRLEKAVKNSDPTDDAEGGVGEALFVPIDYGCDNMRFCLSAHDCQVPTPTSQNLEEGQQTRIFGAD
jgi:hypothetical protein